MDELVKNRIWTDFMPMTAAGLPLGRRVTVARASSGQLVVFSPLKATAERIAELRRLGSIQAFVIPNRFHDRFYDGYFEEFRTSRFLANQASIADHPTWPLSDFDAHREDLDGFKRLTLRGMPRVQEEVFLHEEARTLVLADAVFNLTIPEQWFPRMLMKLAGMGGRPRPSRLFRSMIKVRSEFRESVTELLQWEFDRVIPGHGEVITHNARETIRTAFDFIE